MDVTKKVEQYGSDMLEFLAGLGGLAVGQIIAGFVPKTNIGIVDKLLPGLVNEGLAIGIVAAGYGKDPYAKAASFGLGMSGVANQVYQLTSGKTGILAKINEASAIPTTSLGEIPTGGNFLSGFGRIGQAEEIQLLS